MKIRFLELSKFMSEVESHPTKNEVNVADENAAYFNAMSHVYKESDLVDHDAIVALPLYDRAIAQARKQSPVPRVVDIGAGSGISTLPLLERDCRVIAVDVAGEGLQRLKKRAGDSADRLETVTSDGGDFLINRAAEGETFDVVLCRAMLHHIPDYLDLIRKAIPVIAPGGCYISLADPLRYDTVSRFDRLFAKATYYTMRLFMGNYSRAFRTLLRRSRGGLSESAPEDNVEYHVVRNGVDQEAISKLFTDEGFECEIIPYFGYANPIMRPLGRLLRVHASFACIATRPAE